jgi:hypothetical protein
VTCDNGNAIELNRNKKMHALNKPAPGRDTVPQVSPARLDLGFQPYCAQSEEAAAEFDYFQRPVCLNFIRMRDGKRIR